MEGEAHTSPRGQRARLLIADDHDLVRDGYQRMLDRELGVHGGRGVHPRVDHVLDREMLRRAHQICPLSRLPLHRSHDHKR